MATNSNSTTTNPWRNRAKQTLNRVENMDATERIIWWVLIMIAIGCIAFFFLTAAYTAMLDVCDANRESPNTALSGAVAAASVFLSLVAGHRLLTRRLLALAYAVGIVQTLAWSWVLVYPGGSC